jgi:hypothetical protein
MGIGPAVEVSLFSTLQQTNRFATEMRYELIA